MQATTAPGSSGGEFVDKTDLAPGTKWGATDANAWQAEMLHIITEAGLTPNGADLEQIRKAVQALAKLVKVDNATEADEADHADEADEALNADTVDSVHVTKTGNGLRAIHGNLHGTSITIGAIYDALAPALSDVGDWVPLSGAQVGPTGDRSIVVFSKAERTSSSIITISIARISIDASSIPGSVYVTDTNTGNGSLFIGSGDVTMAW